MSACLTRILEGSVEDSQALERSDEHSRSDTRISKLFLKGIPMCTRVGLWILEPSEVSEEAERP